MKRAVVPLATATLLLAAGASAQVVQFEGRVTGTMSAQGLSVEMEQLMKSSMMRLDMELPGGGGSVSQITNVDSGEMLMVLHEEKMWMDMAMMSQFMPGFSPPAGAQADIELPQFERTERVETIAGHDCRHYILKLGGGHEVDVCAATGLGCFIPGTPAGLGGGPAGGGMPALPQDAELWIAEFGDGFFVLRLEGGGATYVAHEVEPGSPPDEAFRPPDGYTQMKMPLR